MKAYRKRFVQLNMLLIGAVLLIMVVIIAAYMYRDYYDSLETTMSQIVEPLDSFSEPTGMGSSPPDAADERQEPPDESPQKEGIVTVFYTPAEGEIAVLSQNGIFDTDTLAEILEAVVDREDDFGVLRNYHVVYYRTGSGSPYKIALAPTSYIGHSMISLVVVLLAIWLGAMVCFLLVSIRLSGVAVRPMEEAIEREKQFVADASHDLKTPLSVILANNSILRENPQSTVGSLSRWIDSTQNAAKTMQRMIAEMLTLADVERKDSPLNIEDVDASSVVMKAALQLESVAYEKNVNLETEIPDQLLFRTDADYLQRIAASLIENAIKYEPGGGEVLVSLSESKRQVILRVRNRSAFISKEDLPHVFDRFYRGDKSRHGESGGFGLGLSITRQMTERLGGKAEASSDSEKGTVFSVSFPV